MRFAEGPVTVQLRTGARPPADLRRSGRARILRLASSSAGLVLLATPAVLVAGPPSGASTIQTLQSEASSLAIRVDTLNTQLSILSEQYDQAQNRAVTLDRQIHVAANALGSAEKLVQSDNLTLRRQAIYAYVTAGAGSSSIGLTGSANALPQQQTYLQAASGNLTTSVSALQNSEHRLNVQRTTLSKVDAAAKANAATLAAAQSSAESLERQENSALAGVNGQLASALAQQEAEQQAAAQRAVAAQAARAAALAASNPPSSQPTQSGTVNAGSGNAAAALAAGHQALGVPYEWAGASLSGFDCSGFTMWAWSHAGVNLPHSAEAQYDSIQHVSLSDLEPGDLIFYAAGGYIYHVVMYAGGGQVIQAENFGTVVRYTPIPGGAYAAGRP